MALVIGMSSAAAAPSTQAPQTPAAQGASSNVEDGIPSRCNTYTMDERIKHELPHVFNRAGNATTVDNVEFLTDARRTTYAPAAGQGPELHMLQCPVRITWNTGHQDFGYYTEWEDHHQQVRASFTPRPTQPPGQDQ